MLGIRLKKYYLCSMKEIDYKKIPDWWAVCPHQSCKMAETCLRQQACRQIPEKYKSWTCVLPHLWKDEGCERYLKYETVTMAQGLNRIYQNVREKYARSAIRVTLTTNFGSKGSYYRYKDGERLINPTMQQKIIEVVHRFAPDANVEFDKTFKDFDFTTL